MFNNNQDITFQIVSDSISMLNIKTSKFKSSRVAVTFSVPLDEKTVSAFALLPYSLTRTSEKYDTQIKLNNRLAELYGGVISTEVRKNGDSLELKISLDVLSNRLALSDENILKEAAELLISLIFTPKTENGEFSKTEFENERRLAIERIESEINEKRAYTINKTVSVMCEGEPFGLYKYGTIEGVNRLTPEELYETHKELLRTARVNITVISADDSSFLDDFSESFETIIRKPSAKVKNILKPAGEEVKQVSENLDINQGKLALGFRTDKAKTIGESAKTKVMVDLFGGGPYSLLFQNVREKLSLCYYCAARYNREKGIVLVDSGVDQENFEKARGEILKQFEALQKGEFEEQVLKASKKALSDAYASISDSIESLDEWYSSQHNEAKIIKPGEYADLINEVTFEDVVNAANEYKLDTIFKLETNR